MKSAFTLLVAAAGLALVAGCEDTGSNAGIATPQVTPNVALRSGSKADEGACERAVSIQTNNGDVITLSSLFSEAATEVIVGVGPERARWSCIISGGVVGQVMSLTNEGTL